MSDDGLRAPGARPLSILYVEDCIELRDTIAEILRDGGDEVCCCGLAADAQALLAEREFDVMLVDVKLDGIVSGTELARGVLRDRPQQWLIMCSGGAMDDDVAGVNARVLRKPFEIAELEALLDEARRSRVD